jgi:hypothetical protein
MIAYEQQLDRNLRWALREGSKHFEKKSATHKALGKIVRRLDDLSIPYAEAGAMALYFHGLRRFTEEVVLVVSPENLREIQNRLEGLGYIPLFTGSKNLRDAEYGVRIEFLTTGDFPGDGKPKPVAFPDPRNAQIEIEGIHCLRLPALIELKLASGMTNPGRLKDLADVQELIRVLQLPRDEFAAQLNAFVQEKYREIWDAVQSAPSDP